VRAAASEGGRTAEDPARGSMPSPDEITARLPPQAPGVRVHTAAYAGDRVPPDYDPLMAKLIVWAETRTEAVERIEGALAAFDVEGIATTIPFSLELLADDAVRAGTYDVAFVERRLAESGRIRI